MAGIVRQIVGEISQGKTKGKAFEKALTDALSPKSIANEKPKTQKK